MKYFGSFIRDNFRSNIEDAQYLTPIELVDFACNLSLTNIEKKKIETPFIVADPFCGVGSFLERFFTLSQTKLPKINKDL